MESEDVDVQKMSNYSNFGYVLAKWLNVIIKYKKLEYSLKPIIAIKDDLENEIDKNT